MFSSRTLAAYRRIARHDGQIDEYVAKVAAANAAGDCIEITQTSFLDYVGAGGAITTRHGCGSSSVEWYTPPIYVEKARKAMGGIDLDPASCQAAQATVKAKRFYTKLDDGLAHAWWGRVYLNPPFKFPDVSLFVSKLCTEVDAGNVTQAVLLSNSACDTRWWKQALRLAPVVCLTDGRIEFCTDTGVGKSPTCGQSFFYFGDRVHQFVGAFEDVGDFIQRYGNGSAEVP